MPKKPDKPKRKPPPGLKKPGQTTGNEPFPDVVINSGGGGPVGTYEDFAGDPQAPKKPGSHG